ncbi:hypothetical protein SAMN04244553_3741 [Nocardia amikacinitolerans]|uniref:DUF732 domain-containing protein n=1 Tax=Nocardia amikacinitolerans TaxID=756689 RepID=A0A285LKF2_9NOCA|nr:hypothetical protein [Nocardia amikacinitolerans]SNY85415.1 hypothetical protein SAMN04244553_3741 [Nocardia amikacinitolerans]
MPLASGTVRRTSAAIAVSTTLFALLIAGCSSDDKDTATASSTSTSPATQPSGAAVPDSAKAGMFVVSYRSAFPKLAEGRSDAQIAEIFTATCKDIKDGKAEDAIVQSTVDRSKSGQTAASKEEAQAIFTTAKYLC